MCFCIAVIEVKILSDSDQLKIYINKYIFICFNLLKIRIGRGSEGGFHIVCHVFTVAKRRQTKHCLCENVQTNVQQPFICVNIVFLLIIPVSKNSTMIIVCYCAPGHRHSVEPF